MKVELWALLIGSGACVSTQNPEDDEQGVEHEQPHEHETADVHPEFVRVGQVPGHIQKQEEPRHLPEKTHSHFPKSTSVVILPNGSIMRADWCPVPFGPFED